MLAFTLRRLLHGLNHVSAKRLDPKRFASSTVPHVGVSEHLEGPPVKNLVSVSGCPGSGQSSIRSLLGRIQCPWQQIEITETGERAFRFNPLPPVELAVYRQNCEASAKWLRDVISGHGVHSRLLYIGFEAFFDNSFESLADRARRHGAPLAFSPLVKSSYKYVQDRLKYEKMETVDQQAWDSEVIVHLGASHMIDKLLFREDAHGHLQRAWTNGRLVLCSPELFIADDSCYRAGLAPVLKLVGGGYAVPRTGVEPCDYTVLDQEFTETKHRVEAATTLDQVFAEVFRLVTTKVSQHQLNAPIWWDSGLECYNLHKSVSDILAQDSLRMPWTRAALVNARNAAIGDALHSFYATDADCFPLVVSGDTAALLAGGANMISVHSRNRFGVVLIRSPSTPPHHT